MIHLLPTPPKTQIIDLALGPEVNAVHVRADLENMGAALARFHGPDKGREILVQAFAEAFAGWAGDNGRPALMRFALEAAIQSAMARETAARRMRSMR